MCIKELKQAIRREKNPQVKKWLKELLEIKQAGFPANAASGVKGSGKYLTGGAIR